MSKARTSGSVNLILDNGQQANITKQHAEKINEVRQNISSVAGIYPKFFISSDLQMNAYAQGAGGQGVVTITYGLLNRIGNDYDALAAVIGHEFAHLDLDHSSSQATVNAIVDILSTVALKFNDLYDASKGIESATVTTAIPLTDDLKAKVLAKAKELTGKEVTVENIVDENIIGGFILRIGDLQYNASIANQLGKLKREFTLN